VKNTNSGERLNPYSSVEGLRDRSGKPGAKRGLAAIARTPAQ